MKQYDWSIRDGCPMRGSRERLDVATIGFLAVQRKKGKLAIYAGTYIWIKDINVIPLGKMFNMLVAIMFQAGVVAGHRESVFNFGSCQSCHYVCSATLKSLVQLLSGTVWLHYNQQARTLQTEPSKTRKSK